MSRHSKPRSRARVPSRTATACNDTKPQRKHAALRHGVVLVIRVSLRKGRLLISAKPSKTRQRLCVQIGHCQCGTRRWNSIVTSSSDGGRGVVIDKAANRLLSRYGIQYEVASTGGKA